MKKISRIAKFLALLVSFCVPLLAAAQINTVYIKGYSDSITSIINTILVPVLIAIAFITFLWGVYKYFILGADNETQRETGKQFTFWGIIGFVVILSLWGIVNLFMGTLNLSAGTAPKFPTIGAPSGSTGGTTGTSGNNVYCPDGSVVSDVSKCPSASVYCPNGSVVYTVSQCPAS